MSELDEVAESIVKGRTGRDPAILRVDDLDAARRIVREEMPGESRQVIDGVAAALLRILQGRP